jgi:hypothetical protein
VPVARRVPVPEVQGRRRPLLTRTQRQQKRHTGARAGHTVTRRQSA